jgi:hypothetical protein
MFHMLLRHMRAHGGILFLGILVLSLGSAVTPASEVGFAASLPGLPTGWPSSLQLGMADAPGGASDMKATAPFGFRYQYLAGGVNTGAGWSTWNPGGAFVTYYIEDSVASNITPVFTYYMLYQSNPGVSQGETAGIVTNLQNTQTMTAYYNDLKLFFQRAGEAQGPVVLHIEPDLWGFMQSSKGDDATALSVKVSSTGLSDLAGLAENGRGFAQAVVKLRDRYAPNVRLAYHLSTWGAGQDPVLSNPSDAQIDQLATKSANFYQSLQANFDIVFAEFTDRDAGFKQYVYGDGGASWWDAADFSRNVRYLTKFVSVAQKRVVMWQIPLGNKKMRAMNNSWDHYQDNKVEWLLDDSARTNLQAYAQAGVVAFLFGRGADGATCACDDAGDGVTDPTAINGNTTTSLNADDDGGFFRQKASSYYSSGALVLPSGTNQPPATATPSPTATATKTPVASPTATKTVVALTNTPRPSTATPATATETATATPATTQAKWTTSATVSRATLSAGSRQTVTASIKANRNASALVDIEIYSPNGEKVAQKSFDNESFAGNANRTFQMSWSVPSGASTGTYTVKVGVFAPGWAQLYSWQDSATTFRVR